MTTATTSAAAESLDGVLARIDAAIARAAALLDRYAYSATEENQ